MSIFISVLGLIIFLGIAYLFSNDRKNINYRAVVSMLVIQIVLGWFMLDTKIGGKIIAGITSAFNKIISFGNEGTKFVFGGLIKGIDGQPIFFINTLVLIVFISTLLSLLTYLRVIPFLVKYIGGALSKITGLPKLESFTAVNSLFFGDTGAILAVKSRLGKLSTNRLFIVCTSALTSVSVTIIGAYMQMIPPEYVLVALPLNIFSGLIVASIVSPVSKEEKDEDFKIKDMVQDKSLFESIGNGALDGGKVALIVGAMLVAYIGLMAMLNFVVENITGLKIQEILGYILSPVAYLMGIPAGELTTAGGVMGTKIITNEFVAMLDLVKIMPHLTHKTIGIVSSFLISFANFSSIGIIVGTVQAISGEQAAKVSRFGIKMLLFSTLASIITGTVVGLFL